MFLTPFLFPQLLLIAQGVLLLLVLMIALLKFGQWKLHFVWLAAEVMK
jgi:hypothetical protein